MSKELKALYLECQNDTSLPPLDDNDDYFTSATSAQKHQYIFIVLKKALKVFLKNKELAKYQTEKIFELEARIKRLENKIQKNIG